jgi:hypothetical protein
MTIEERLKSLERQLSLTRWLLIFVILILAGAMAWKSTTIIPVVEAKQVDNSQQGIRSKTFILEDKNGRIRGMWGFSNEGNPVLQVYDNNGKARTSIGVDKIGDEITPRFMLLDGDEKQSAGLFSRKEGSAFILSGKNSQRIMAAVYNDEPSIRLFDKEGTERISLVIKKDATVIVLSDKNGKVIEGLGK